MKPKNKKIYTGDLLVLKEEYTALGFDTDLTDGVLTVFTIKRRKPKEDKKGTKRR
jgi:hypothetical protein